MITTRVDGRSFDQIRPISVTFDAFGYADASVLFEQGRTKVLVSVSMQNGVPHFLKGQNVGWLNAEYAMLPTSATKRIQRESSQHHRNSRGVEISRLIGRSLRSVVDVSTIGERTIIIDCDVLQADGGTRVAAISAASIALQCAQERWLNNGIIEKRIVHERIAAISVGIVSGSVLLDLNQVEDNHADIDFNFILTESGNIIEIQGTAEKKPVSWEDFGHMKKMALTGVSAIFSKSMQFSGQKQNEQKRGHKIPLFSLAARAESS